MKVLIDAGHGKETKGKRSPDGRLQEWAYCREIAAGLEKALAAKGIKAKRIVTEDSDITLGERCRRVNEVCKAEGAKNVLLVSIHNNAAGNGKNWCSARGWSGWVYTACSDRSKRLAQYLYAAAEKRGLKGNRSVPSCKYWTANFYILRKTNCAAVLTENLFQDNKEDVQFLLSDEGKKAIIDLHVEGIMNYIYEIQ
jgi:N-acetylmuramoyl-L-alanine amidase